MKSKIISFFNQLNKDRMDLVEDFYDYEVQFVDPLGEHRGLESLKAYYSNLYQNVTEIRFEFGDIIEDQLNFSCPWVMHFSAKGLKGGKPIQVEGLSHIRFSPTSQKAVYHRDYFDMGAFVYEHIPVLKSVIAFVKQKLKN